MQFRTYILLGAALLAILVFATGCGSADDDDTATERDVSSASSQAVSDDAKDTSNAGQDAAVPADTKAEFIKVANPVCAESQEQISAKASSIFDEDKGLGSREEVIKELLNDAVAPGLEEEIDKLRSLGPPSVDKAQVEAIFTAMQEVIDRARENPSAVGAQERPFAKSEALARKYGLTGCGGPG